MRTKTITIAGMSPPEYAALWGATSGGGVMFYGFAQEGNQADRAWLVSFAKLIMAQIHDCLRSPDLFEPQDPAELAQLLAFVLAMPGRD